MKDWEYLEFIVQVLEKTLNPNSVLERDVDLPVLTSQIGSTRQCDVVIRTGKPPRQIITIIEVQKRERAVEIGTFDGWVEKMRSVGAQRLICVSQNEFPASIKEKALQAGNTIILMKLTDDPKQIPIDFVKPSFSIKRPEARIKSISVATGSLDPTIQIEMTYLPNDKVFNYKNSKYSINDFIEEQKLKLGSGHVITKEKEDNDPNSFFLEDNDQVYFIEFIEIVVDMYEAIYEIPLAAFTYMQEGADALAWLIEGKTKIDGKDIVVGLVVHRRDDGDFEVRRTIISDNIGPIEGFSIRYLPK